MKVYNAESIKNIAVVGHGGAGKTTLVEAFLFDSGATERRGRVEDGNTTTDFDPEEVKRHFSLTAAMAPVEWKGFKLNFIDAPGYFDFEGEATQAYYLADSALVLVNASSGVEVGVEKAFNYCRKRKKPLVFLVNQIDKEHADFEKILAELRKKFGSAVTPMQVPFGGGDKYKGYADVIENAAFTLSDKGPAVKTEVPGNIEAFLGEYRELLIENAASSDEALMEKYFDGQELSREDIMKGLTEGVKSGSLFPVYVCSAAQNLGVREVLDELVLTLPSASEAPAMPAFDAHDKEIEIAVSKDGAFAGQIMKTIADQFVGKISLVKVIRGVLKNDTQVYNVNADKGEKFGSVSVMLGKNLLAVDSVPAGDIGAIAKLQFSVTGDTLADASAKVRFAPMAFSEPCISLAVSAKKQGEEEKVFSGLHRLEEEDPTFKMSKNGETGDMLLNGMGEMHIEVICQKLKNKFGVEAALSDPKVAYRETIRKAASAEGKHKKQSGGAGQFGVVQIKFEPMKDSAESFEFVNAVVGGVVPKEFIPAVEKGLRESITRGVLAGYPMVNLRATLFDGKYHPVDSKEVAFKSAARLAYKAACAVADPVLLEPIGKAEVVIPDEYMGDIIGDLNRRRGRILGMTPVEDGQQVVAEVPMSEMVKYATDLRSMTQARGTFRISFERYEEMPASMAQKVIENAKKEEDED